MKTIVSVSWGIYVNQTVAEAGIFRENQVNTIHAVFALQWRHNGELPTQRASNAENASIWRRNHDVNYLLHLSV